MNPIPSGTRDVLPDEMRELRAITNAMREALEAHGFGEIYTPAIEYETADAPLRAGGSGVYRLFDDHGDVLRLRSDMTVPIARMAATRYATVAPPLRFCSFAHVYRGVTPHRGQMREFLQAGAELIGADGAAGTAEALTVLCAALDATGLREYRIGLGDARLFGRLCAEYGVGDAAPLLDALVRRDHVALEREGHARGLPESVLRIPQTRGGIEVLEGLDHLTALREVHDALAPGVAERVIFDLGLVRDLDYYTGAVFEVYDPAAGAPLGGGGRYDDLLAVFGRDLPAVGWAIGVDRLHIALAGEEARAR